MPKTARSVVVLIALALTVALAGVVPLATSASAGAGSYFLNPGEQLLPGQSLISQNSRSKLTMQTDGNLVLYGFYDQSNGYTKPLWQSNTAGNSNAIAAFQTDGNFVVYRSDGYPLWASGTQGTGANQLILQTDSNLVMYNPSGAVWATSTFWSGILYHLTPSSNFVQTLQNLRWGDTLLVDQGTYNVGRISVTVPQGTPDAPITISNTSTTPVLQGSIALVDPSYWIVQGMSFQNIASTKGPNELEGPPTVTMQGGQGWIFRNNEITGAAADNALANLAMNNSSNGPPVNYQVVADCFHDAGVPPSNDTQPNDSRFHNIYFSASGSAPGYISRNTFANAPYGSQVKIGAGKASDNLEGPSGVKLRYNTMVASDRGVVIVGRVTSTLVQYNLIKNTPTDGVDVVASTRQLNPGESANQINSNYFRTPYGSKGPVDIETQKIVANTSTAANNIIGAEPGFDGISCGQFHPSYATAQQYGVYSSANGSGY